METLALTLPSEAASGAAARRALEGFLATVPVDVPAILLAVSEAVNNAVIHGYRGDRDGAVELSVECGPDTVTVVVADSGVGMSPNPDGDGLGFGLAVIGAFADSVQVEATQGGGTRVTMGFARRPATDRTGG